MTGLIAAAILVTRSFKSSSDTWELSIKLMISSMGFEVGGSPFSWASVVAIYSEKIYTIKDNQIIFSVLP